MKWFGIVSAAVAALALASLGWVCLARNETNGGGATSPVPQESKAMKFGYTLLYVKDVKKTVGFYESAFGLKRKLVHPSGYGEMDTGATKLGFATFDLARSNGVTFTEPQPQGAAPAVGIAFVTDDVNAAYERATKAGAEAVAPPKQKPWGQTVAYVRDLNGFLVELCTAVPE